jgi:hypothetical protein
VRGFGYDRFQLVCHVGQCAFSDSVPARLAGDADPVATEPPALTRTGPQSLP